MAKLEDLQPGSQVLGIIPQQAVLIIDSKWHGTSAVELIYKRADGQPDTQLLFRSDEDRIEIVETGLSSRVVRR